MITDEGIILENYTKFEMMERPFQKRYINLLDKNKRCLPV